ncbi:MAG: orotate phosphoribosyltransferase [Bacillota bacterium]|jgi:orotate phosphoribosyltransferase
MLTREQIIDIFKVKDVLLEGHFRLSSGRHAQHYLQCAKILQYPADTEVLAKQLAQLFVDEKITVVAGPAIGAIILAYEVARALGVRSIFGERENGVMTFRRGFQLNPEDKVLVVEDVITTGGSTKELIEAVKKSQATLVGVGSLVDRSGGKVDFGIPFKPLLSFEIQSYMPEECPLCKQGVSDAVKPGSKQE